MRRTSRRDKKGISTIIATIIIVAIAIVMAIAVAYWALGIGGAFTRFEKLQFVSAYATSDSEIEYTIKNSGTAAATIDTVFINGQPTGVISYTTGQALLEPGENATGTITWTTPVLSSGTTVEVKIQSTSGNQYPQVVLLP